MTKALTLPFRVLGGFLSWWLGELAGLIPRPLRRIVAARRDSVILEPNGAPSGQGGKLFVSRGGKVEALGEYGEGVAALPPKARRGRQAVTLALPSDQAVTQRVSLPLAAEENLREVIGFEMDRLTPFRREEVYFDHRILDRNAAQQLLTVDLTLSPKDAVDGYLEQAGKLGLTPQHVDIATGEPGRPRGLDLLRKRVRRGPGGFARAVTALLLIAAAVLGGASLWIPLDRKAEFSRELTRQVKEARANAAEARKVEDEIVARRERVLYVQDLRRRTPTLSYILDDVTTLLPDDTWLYQLRVHEGRIELSGYSPNSSTLIQLFEESEGFAEPRFRAPVTQDPKLGVDRFSLELRLPQEERAP